MKIILPILLLLLSLQSGEAQELSGSFGASPGSILNALLLLEKYKQLIQKLHGKVSGSPKLF